MTMGCCGQGRAALRQAGARRTEVAPAAPAVPAPPAGGRDGPCVRLQYRAGAPVVVRGVASGRLYTFDVARDTAEVAEADAPALLRSGHFVRAG
jgi:hypothetical protein